MLPELATAGLEQALNALLRLDPGATKQLAKLHGQVVAVVLRGLALELYFVADESGQLQVLGQHEGTADAVISGSPFNLIRATDSQEGSAQLFAGDMSITGNTELAHQFSGILGNLDIDWEEHLSRVTGDIVAHKTGHAIREMAAWWRNNSERAQQNGREYLQEEVNILPEKQEVEAFFSDVESLRDDVARLAARITNLQQKLNKETD